MTRDELASRAAALIDRLAKGGRDDGARNALLCDLLRFQAAHVAPYGRLARARGTDLDRARTPDEMPALPTDVFRFTRVAVHGPERDVRVFRSSGTTSTERSTSALPDLSLYDRAARAAAKHAFFPGVERIQLVMLAPTETAAPDSSLAYMLARFVEWFGTAERTYAWNADTIDLDALDRAFRSSEPVALCGTSFAFVHALDRLAARGAGPVALSAGSRIMHTGGYKGRSREIAPAELRARMTAAFGIPESHIVAEYGMTELSSQLWETTLCEPQARRRLWVPGWIRVTAVDAETLATLPPGEAGILRIDDCANIDTVAAIQTADLGRVVQGGVELLGRTKGAVPRGCSLAADDALGRRA